jgi:hypothetical protein
MNKPNKDELLDLNNLIKNIDFDLKKNRDSFLNQIETEGENLLKNIEKKRKQKNLKKKPLIDYIIKHSNNYDVDNLYEFDYNDVMDIYNDVKYYNRPWWIKMFELFFR